MNELTNCEVDIVGGDGEFVVSRVRSGEDLPPSLLFSPALERPAPAVWRSSSVLLRCGAS